MESLYNKLLFSNANRPCGYQKFLLLSVSRFDVFLRKKSHSKFQVCVRQSWFIQEVTYQEFTHRIMPLPDWWCLHQPCVTPDHPWMSQDSKDRSITRCCHIRHRYWCQLIFQATILSHSHYLFTSTRANYISGCTADNNCNIIISMCSKDYVMHSGV